MTPYEKRLQEDLDAIRARIRKVGVAVDTGLKNAVHSFMVRDRKLANETVLADLPINREIRTIDRMCHAFIARHLPSSMHLRFVSSVLRLTIELERIGDYAVIVAREASQIEGELPESVLRDVELLADQSRNMLSQAVRAFDEGNAELARGTKAMETQIDVSFDKVFADLTEAGDKGKLGTSELFALLSVFNSLERVSDQAKNVCEEAVFYADGERKPAKTYRVLFIDRDGSKFVPMALGYATKAHPEALAVQGGSCEPTASIDSAVDAFLDDKGHSTENYTPSKIDFTEDELGKFHVVVGLDCCPRECLKSKPFHTVYLEWPISDEAAKIDGSSSEQEAVYRALSLRIRALTELLRGEEAI